jgi:hypothetical protein
VTVTREPEVAALQAIEEAYQRWTVTSDVLHRDVAEAAERRGGAPVQSLRTDFDAQLAVTRSVAAFAHICPDSGPDIDGLPGAAFIQALHHVGSQPGLDQSLDELERQWQSWLAALDSWSLAADTPPPARPTSDAHTRVLAAVDDWWGFGADRLHEQLIESLTAQGHHVVETTTTGADGELIQSAHVTFERDSSTPGLWARLRALLHVRDHR